MPSKRGKRPPVRVVPLVEFVSYSRSVLRELGKTANKYGQETFTALLDLAAAEAARIEREARTKEN